MISSPQSAGNAQPSDMGFHALIQLGERIEFVLRATDS